MSNIFLSMAITILVVIVIVVVFVALIAALLQVPECTRYQTRHRKATTTMVYNGKMFIPIHYPARDVEVCIDRKEFSDE